MQTLPGDTDLDNCYVTPSVGVGRVLLSSFLASPTYLGGAAGSVASAGTTQADATPITKNNTAITAAFTGEGVRLPVATAGRTIMLINDTTGAPRVYGESGSGDNINGVAAASGVIIRPQMRVLFTCAVAGTWYAWVISRRHSIVNANTDTGSAVLSVASMVGALSRVTLNLTGTLAGAANMQLPTVAVLWSQLAVPDIATSYVFRAVNKSAGAFTWTMTTNTGWTLNDTMTIPQNTWRDFQVYFTSASAATFTSLGSGTV